MPLAFTRQFRVSKEHKFINLAALATDFQTLGTSSRLIPVDRSQVPFWDAALEKINAPNPQQFVPLVKRSPLMRTGRASWRLGGTRP